MPADTALMEKLTALCKRRGFIYPSSEIYGGIGGFWDYGPLGVELKRNIKNAWWHDMVTNPPAGPDGREVEMVGVDCTIIMNPKVWEASGHATGFADPMVDCKECKGRFRADQVFHVALYRSDESFSPFDQLSVEANDEQSAITNAKPRAEKLSKKHGGGSYICRAIQLSDYFKANSTANKHVSCPNCDAVGTLTEPRAFNLMFKTYVGALEDASAQAYLRPETAQGIFANFKNVLDTTRVKLPFGIAQVGKAFRNEINPRNFTFRSREFEQMEIEFFCREEESMTWWEWWRDVRIEWYKQLGLTGEKLHPRNQDAGELAHYSKACTDIEYLFPFSDEPQELEGVAHRGCFDLTQHQTHSGKDMSYFDDEAWQRDAVNYKDDKNAAKEAKSRPPYKFLPTVIEPSAGADRAALAFLCEAYTEDQAPNDKGQMETRVLMKFHPRLAPIKAAFLPLVNKEGMPDVAQRLYREAKKHMNVFYDDGGAIGRRYRRQDEAGTPFCITVDGDTIGSDGPNAGTVTVRDRDTLKQERIPLDRVVPWLRERVG